MTMSSLQGQPKRGYSIRSEISFSYLSDRHLSSFSRPCVQRLVLRGPLCAGCAAFESDL